MGVLHQRLGATRRLHPQRAAPAEPAALPSSAPAILLLGLGRRRRAHPHRLRQQRNRTALATHLQRRDRPVRPARPYRHPTTRLHRHGAALRLDGDAAARPRLHRNHAPPDRRRPADGRAEPHTLRVRVRRGPEQEPERAARHARRESRAALVGVAAGGPGGQSAAAVLSRGDGGGAGLGAVGDGDAVSGGGAVGSAVGAVGAGWL